ncbi:hypothetical protein N431DRAFT_497705 [Stipitochalara longipes BDJ]|nr:hypothetical protein N431DRAFT_497705 [Stipitochalara longipes BDJ]
MDSTSSIRILQLLPGKYDSPIQCTTRISSLSKAEPYEAVSYVWGKGPRSRRVLVDGDNVGITETLYAALRRFRNPIASRSIWVDQLCIDQSNVKEKTQQVNLMGDIYKQCTRSLTWFGEIPEVSAGITTGDAQIVFNFIRALAGDDMDSMIFDSLLMFGHADGTRRAIKAIVRSCNYELDVATLYRNVTIDLIEANKGLKPLLGLRNHSELPTWVLDLSWCPTIDVTYFYQTHAYRYDWYDACNKTPLNMQVVRGHTVISLTGRFMDKIEKTSPVLADQYGGGLKGLELAATMTSWWKVVEEHASKRVRRGKYVNGESWFDAFCRMALGDLITEDVFPQRKAKQSDSELVMEFMRTGNQAIVSTSIHRMTTRQRFFISADGYIGLCPPNTVKGDEIWVLSGGKVPFVLRSRGQTGRKSKAESIPEYTLVGNAYVQGIMYGEGLQQCNGLQDIYLN